MPQAALHNTTRSSAPYKHKANKPKPNFFSYPMTLLDLQQQVKAIGQFHKQLEECLLYFISKSCKTAFKFPTVHQQYIKTAKIILWQQHP